MKHKLAKILVLVGMLALAAGCSSQQQAAGSDSDVGVSHVRQLVAADNKTARTIMWQAQVKQPYTLEYRSGGGEARSLAATDSSFSDVKADYIQYTAQLENLQPGTSYEYRINTEKSRGAWHKLQTEQGGAFTALIFPDSQSSDYSGWQQLARDATARHPESSLYVNMGDLVDNGQDASQWRAWLNSVEPFSDRLPLAPLPGNHEAYSLEWQVAFPQSYVHLFQVPANGLPQYPKQFYSFDYGPVHFTVLDTNFPELKELQPQLWEEELAWLRQDLAAAKAKWKIVLQHRDIMLYGFGPESGRAQTEARFIDVGQTLMPIFEEYKVDAVLSAHLHTYRRRVPLRNFAPAEDGITYILTGVAGSVRYPKLWADWEWDAARAPKPETANYMTLQADEQQLVFRAFLPDGRQFDEYVMKK